jgi:hypothetical protein
MTYHINGNRSSSSVFHDAPWLDFNMVQVWGNDPIIPATLSADYRRTPVKPTGLGEASYEDGPQYPIQPIDAAAIRRQAYWSYLAGGYYTYGNTNTWNLGAFRPEATDDWIAALRSDGARHLSVLASILPSIDWAAFAPEPAAVRGGAAGLTPLAMRDASARRLLVYLPAAAAVVLELSSLGGGRMHARWANPQTGAWLAPQAIASGPLTPPPGWADALLLVEPEDAVR